MQDASGSLKMKEKLTLQDLANPDTRSPWRDVPIAVFPGLIFTSYNPHIWLSARMLFLLVALIVVHKKFKEINRTLLFVIIKSDGENASDHEVKHRVLSIEAAWMPKGSVCEQAPRKVIRQLMMVSIYIIAATYYFIPFEAQIPELKMLSLLFLLTATHFGHGWYCKTNKEFVGSCAGHKL